jgi:hypothetical protein
VEGTQSIRVGLAEVGGKAGASQTVEIDQEEVQPLVLRGMVRAENLTGDADSNCALYVDLFYTDGTPLFGQTLPIASGTRDFEHVELVIAATKPVQRAMLHLLMRGNHTGTVWFDDVFLGVQGADRNSLVNGEFEGPQDRRAEIDGVYIDSYEFWATTLNYDRAHFAAADLPLVFDSNTREVGAMVVFSTFEFEREMARRMHDRGKYAMANGVLYNFDFPASHLDVLGTETNWFPNGAWAPLNDAELCFRRALCYQKPYCFLLNTHYADLTLDDVERYMQRALFYGMFSGFFSENAADQCYFENPAWYGPARPLFRKYLPLAERIAAAGWQPITIARSSNPRVYVERYGEPETGVVYFAALNDGTEAATASVMIELGALCWSEANVTAIDLFSNTPVETLFRPGVLFYEVTLDAQTVHLVELERE